MLDFNSTDECIDLLSFIVIQFVGMFRVEGKCQPFDDTATIEIFEWTAHKPFAQRMGQIFDVGESVGDNVITFGRCYVRYRRLILNDGIEIGLIEKKDHLDD